MSGAHISTVRRMLESVLEEATDPEIAFKLRTALQLLVLIEERQAGARSSLAEADLDAEPRENLRDLECPDWRSVIWNVPTGGP